jgi:hypothetical protein
MESTKLRWEGPVARMGKKNAYRASMVNIEGQKPLSNSKADTERWHKKSEIAHNQQSTLHMYV